MPQAIIPQTEKAYFLSQENNTYLVSFVGQKSKAAQDSFNKIELKKLLVKQGLTPIKITSSNAYQKTKRRAGGKVTVKQVRPKKFFITLAEGQKLSEETLATFVDNGSQK